MHKIINSSHFYKIIHLSSNKHRKFLFVLVWVCFGFFIIVFVCLGLFGKGIRKQENQLSNDKDGKWLCGQSK